MSNSDIGYAFAAGALLGLLGNTRTVVIERETRARSYRTYGISDRTHAGNLRSQARHAQLEVLGSRAPRGLSKRAQLEGLNEALTFATLANWADSTVVSSRAVRELKSTIELVEAGRSYDANTRVKTVNIS